MTSKDLIDACDILVKLEQEFSTEEAKLSEISSNHAIKIDELDQQITTFRRNEDVDFRVFSPRNVSTGNSEKIEALEDEKKQLEREKKDADKQLRYYSGKTEMIGRVLSILRGELKEDSKPDDPFSFIDEPEAEKEKNKIILSDDNGYDEVEALFNNSPKVDFDTDNEPGSENNLKMPDYEYNGVPVDEVERVCHKVEFCEKIISNDGVRAKLEIKNIVSDLKDLIRAYRE